MMKFLNRCILLTLLFVIGCTVSKFKLPRQSNRECKLVNYPVNIDSSYVGNQKIHNEYLDFLNSKNVVDVLYIYEKSGGYKPNYKRLICDSIGNWYFKEYNKIEFRKVMPSSSIVGLKSIDISPNLNYNTFCINQNATPPFTKDYFFKNKFSSYRCVQLLCPNSNPHDIFDNERDKIKWVYVIEDFLNNLTTEE